jgi:fatty-acid peroxygenase
MSAQDGWPVDDSLGLLIEGYAWLPSAWRRAGNRPVRTRLLGQPAVAVRGPDAVRFFSDEQHIHRHAAIPEPVQATLFGHGAVHTLDGPAHVRRRHLFQRLLHDSDQIDRLVGAVERAWDQAVPSWSAQRDVVLFDETSRVITQGVCEWAGVPLPPGETAGLASDLVALVDGFATLGPRHWRARRARARRERWLAGLVSHIQAGATAAPNGSAAELVAAHLDADGKPLTPRLAAVELLNIIRPTVAVSWFVAFTAHALHRWPVHRDRLRQGGQRYAQAMAHEVRRFYPFAPFVAGRAVTDLTWQDQAIPAGSLVLLDIFGQNHDESLWPQPYQFKPDRFLNHPPGRDDLIPQGGGDPATSHRCPGEDLTVSLLTVLAQRLAELDYAVPRQDLAISLRRIPAHVRTGVVIQVQDQAVQPMSRVRHMDGVSPMSS